jgi:hypothetical protein
MTTPSAPSNTNNDLEFYKILLDTRNLEIRLFWERSNYFLVLNSALAVGVFTSAATKYTIFFEVIGLLVAILWFLVCLGSKFWQTRWERRLHEFESDRFGALKFFAADSARIKEDVQKAIKEGGYTGLQRMLYQLMQETKPSVSYSMVRLSLLFILGWGILILFSLISL